MDGLIIRHGSPHWWLSPDIWVTPVGAADTAAPGIAHPIAGDLYDVWVQVWNPDTTIVQDWSLFIMWAVPTVGPIPLSATTPLNETSINVSSGYQIFQAVTQWRPSFLNGGHECLVAVTFNNATPFPFASLDGDAGPDTNWSIAQHNLGVVELGPPKKTPRFHYAFQVCNSAAEERGFVVAARQAPLSEVEWFMTGLPGDRKANEKPGKVQGLGLVASAHPDPSELKAATSALERVKVGAHSCRALSLVGTLDAGTALIHVTQTIDERIVGGLSVLVLAEGR